MNKQTNKRLIKGVEYFLTENPSGFQVTCNSNLTDRFHRSYQVNVRDGRVINCSCPQWYYRGGICKHMKAVQNELN